MVYRNIIAFVFFLMLAGCYSMEAEKTGLEGKTLPSFGLLLPDSITKLNTDNIPSGKPIVLFYYGPHCPYSRAQMQEMIDNISILKNIQFYLITTASLQEMKRFNSHYQVNKYPNVITGIDYNRFFGNYFKVAGVPFTAVYSKDKKLINAFEGRIFTKQIIKSIDQ